MTLLRGYCPTCNGPLWRAVWEGCMPCWLYALTSQDVTDDASDGVVVSGRIGLDEANSTANTAATSTWLPRVWVCARTERRELGERGTVVWFRQTDEPDALATETTFARSLLVEELGHPSYPSVAP